MQIGLQTQFIKQPHNKGYAMGFAERMTRETYGKVIALEVEPETAYFIRGENVFPAGWGLPLLERQKRLAEFLVDCCGLLLQDLSLDFGTENPWNWSECSQEIRGLPDIDSSSLTSMMLQAPFQGPNQINLEALRTFIAAKKAQAEDEFWLVKEDPSYFAEALREEAELSVTTDGYFGSENKLKELSELTWDQQVSRMVYKKCETPFALDALLKEMQSLETLRVNCHSNILSERTLRKAYEGILGAFSILLITILREYHKCYTEILYSIPTFKKYFTGVEVIAGRPAFFFRDNPQDYLYWLCGELANKRDDSTQFCSWAILIHELELLFLKDREEKKRLTPRMINIISDLAIMTEIERHFHMSWEYGRFARSELLPIPRRSPALGPLYKISTALYSGKYTGLGEASKDLRWVDYPSEKRRTAMTTAKMRAAEECLDGFWKKCNEYILTETGMSLAVLENRMTSPRTLLRTEPWFESETESIDISTESLMTTAQALLELETRTEQTIAKEETLISRQKVKTRGQPSLEQGDLQHELIERDTPTSKSPDIKIFVSNKIIRTFAALFRVPLTNSLP